MKLFLSNPFGWSLRETTLEASRGAVPNGGLVIPASTIASESVFGTGSRIIADFQSCMTIAKLYDPIATVEALV